MDRIISIHEYQLKKGVSTAQFEEAVTKARKRELFNLPGLIEYHFLRHLRGTRKVDYSAIWIYQDLDAWESLWGKVADPIKKEHYPDKWRIWEDQILKPLLNQDPDQILYAAYEEF